MVFIFLCIFAICCILFGRWGLNTKAGQEMFPEMAGTIPVFAEIGGYILLAGTILTYLALKFFFKT